MKIVVLMTFLSFLVACGQQQGKTNAKISVAALTGSANYGGGLMLFAENLNTGASLIQPVPPSDEINLELANGRWSFRVLGWDGGDHGKIFEGIPKCDFADNLSLNGVAVSLNFSPSFTKCQARAALAVNLGRISSVNQIIDPSPNHTGFYRLAVSGCVGITDRILSEGITPDNSQLLQLGCGGSNGKFMKSSAMAYRVNYLKRDLQGNYSSGIVSDCRPLSEEYRNYTGINLPTGDAFGINRFEFESFQDSGCTQSLGKTRLSTGLGQTNFSDDLRGVQVFNSLDNKGNSLGNNSNYYGVGENWMFVALDNPGCTPITEAASPFALSDGDSHLICTAAQWQNITSNDPDGIFTLGQDIDLSSGNTTLSGTFSGEIIGNGNVIFGGDQPLFQEISGLNTASGDQTRLSNFGISNFSIDLDSGGAFGILANTVTAGTAGSSKGVEIENIYIDGNSYIANIGSGNPAGSVGGIVGLVDMTAATVNDDRFSLRNCVSNAAVASASTMETTSGPIPSPTTTVSSAGALIGMAIGATGERNINLEFNGVGIDPDLPESEDVFTNTSVDPAFIQGHSHVGGFIGYAEETEIRYGNVAKTILKGKTNVGGMVGTVGPKTEIRDSAVFTVYQGLIQCSTALTCGALGGVVGRVASDSSFEIKGTVNTFVVKGDLPGLAGEGNFLNNVGGLIGAITDAADQSSRVEDNRADVDFLAQGERFGGLVGVVDFSNGTNDQFQRNVVSGSMSQVASHANNFTWGGLAGRVLNAGFRMNIVDDLYLETTKALGGAIGEAADFRLVENDISFSEIVVTDGTEALVGGLVGLVDTGGVTVPMNANKISGQITLTNIISGTGCNGTTKCGLFVGDILEDEMILDYNLATASTSIRFQDDNPVTGVLAQGFFVDTTNFTSGNLFQDETVEADCDTIRDNSGYPFFFDGSECSPLFKFKWLDSGYDVIGGNYLAGGLLEPFPINTYEDWNKIGNDAFMLAKSHEVLGDIDFAGETFNPVAVNSGSGLTGKIFGPGRIRGVDYTGATYGDEGLVGLITNGGSLGLRDYPLRIEDVDLACNRAGGVCGIVGTADSGDLFVHANDIRITEANGPVAIGGLVGQVRDRVEIDGSFFRGHITAGSGSVGGLVGFTWPSQVSNLTISESFVDLRNISGGSSVGGLIGNVSPSAGSSVIISDSYVWLDREGVHAGTDLLSGGDAGFIAGSVMNLDGQDGAGGSPGFFVDDVYVDRRGATASAGTFSISDDGGTVEPSIGEVYIMDSHGDNTPFSSAAVTVPSHAGLIISSGFGDDDWVLNSDGDVVLRWQIEGFDN